MSWSWQLRKRSSLVGASDIGYTLLRLHLTHSLLHVTGLIQAILFQSGQLDRCCWFRRKAQASIRSNVEISRSQ